MPPHINAVGLIVHLPELAIDRRLLAIILGYADAADGFLNGLVDLGQGARTLPGDVASEPPEGQGHEGHNGRHGQHGQGQPPIDGHEDEDKDKGRGQLVHHVGGDSDHFAELLGVAGDTADDTSRTKFVEK